MPNGKAYNRKKDKEKLRKIDCLSENGYAVDFFMLFGGCEVGTTVICKL